MALQAPRCGQGPPERHWRRGPSVSPLAGGAGGGAGGEARCAELAGWKQGQGAPRLSAPHGRPAPAAPAATARGHGASLGDSR